MPLPCPGATTTGTIPHYKQLNRDFPDFQNYQDFVLCHSLARGRQPPCMVPLIPPEAKNTPSPALRAPSPAKRARENTPSPEAKNPPGG